MITLIFTFILFLNNVIDIISPELKYIYFLPIIYAITIILDCIKYVPSEHCGIYRSMVRGNKKLLPEGIHFVNPISSTIIISKKIKTINYENSYFCRDAFIYKIILKVNVIYCIAVEEILNQNTILLDKDYNFDIKNKILPFLINQTLQETISNYENSFFEYIKNIEKINREIYENLRQKASKYSVILKDIIIDVNDE